MQNKYKIETVNDVNFYWLDISSQIKEIMGQTVKSAYTLMGSIYNDDAEEANECEKKHIDEESLIFLERFNKYNSMQIDRIIIEFSTGKKIELSALDYGCLKLI